MKTSELRQTIKDMNLSGLVSCDFTRMDAIDGKYNHVIIGNNRLSFDTQKEQEKVYNMLVYKFGFEAVKVEYSVLSEEDMGYFEGWEKDMADPNQHGRTISVGITSEHGGSHIAWDYNLQKAVDFKDLTPAPEIL